MRIKRGRVCSAFDFEKAYDSVRKEVLYNIIVGFGVSMNLVRLIKLRLKETHSNFRRSKHWSYTLPRKNGLEKGDTLSRCFSALLIICLEEDAATRSGFN
jgi:hypothetical protein